jgi:two-component system osmolarity sensor histidine kinase EnvZ
VALLVQLYEESDKSPAAIRRIEALANNTLSLGLTIEKGQLPPPLPEPLFSRTDQRLNREFTVQMKRPFWLDSRQQPEYVEVRVLTGPDTIFHFRTRGERTFATSTGFLLALMLLSSLLLLGIATIFLRNQIRPITDLARAAQSFGTGRDLGGFKPRGAREVRAAGVAFLDMRDRIAKQVEQRTAMLAGVSHDLRTILTRFKLELAVLGDGPKVQPLKEDVDEMQRMLEAYMAFVKGDAGEPAQGRTGPGGGTGGPHPERGAHLPQRRLRDRRAAGPAGARQTQCLRQAARQSHRQRHALRRFRQGHGPRGRSHAHPLRR